MWTAITLRSVDRDHASRRTVRILYRSHAQAGHRWVGERGREAVELRGGSIYFFNVHNAVGSVWFLTPPLCADTEQKHAAFNVRKRAHGLCDMTQIVVAQGRAGATFNALEIEMHGFGLAGADHALYFRPPFLLKRLDDSLCAHALDVSRPGCFRPAPRG